MRGRVKNTISNKRERAKNAVYLRHTQKQPFNFADYTDSNPWSEAPRSVPDKRCVKGTRRHPKTKVCTKFVNGKFTSTPEKNNLVPNKIERCKKGTRRHPKTKVCKKFENGKFVASPR